ncbi:monocarboxylate transporter 9-like [Aricia agestis]|uniref:monocarboxylate transporter 9-like n=1 Tax=Aricia agestis TaxID=91739 RepID=UPI001C204395|nr:monocarboxylate transporter 9-like [Aricia agestis]XP_041977948.1 monocarboxylate transporter 9-like [Aricia agestis]XP_041977949.1 monocarboxylate transporter 9-like [Aricia agestis]
MDTQRVYANGINNKDKSIIHNDKIPSEDDRTTSPLLERANDIKYIDGVEPVDVEHKNDLNTINSMKTHENGINNRLSVEYSKDDNEDAKSTNERVKFLGVGDDDSICSSKHEEPEPQIPDGGWGWVVVAASFLIATVADGLAFSYGLLQIKFVDFFEASEAKTSLIGSLFISVPLIAGPIMSALVDRYGCKKMTIVGGIFSTVGFVAASYSNSVEVLYVTYGIIAGLGMGLLYVTAVVSIAYWFEKRRNLAVGLGSCGVGFGTFIYSPLTTYLLDEYGWRGALLLLAGTVLNVCVCGAVMRDPEWLILEQKKQRRLSKSKRANSSTSISARSARSGGGESLYLGAEELKHLVQSGEDPEHILTSLVAAIAEAESVEAATKRNADLSSQQKVSSVINLPTFLRQSEKITPEVLDQLTSNERLYNIILTNYPSLLALRSTSDTKLNVETPTKEKLSKKKKKRDFDKKLKMVRENLLQPVPENNTLNPKVERHDWLMKTFQTDRHYLRDIRVHRNSIMHRGAMMNIAKYRLKASSCPDIYKNSMWSMEEDQEERTWGKKLLHAINKTFDFNMFTEFHFLMMNLSTLVLFIWFIVPYFYISTFMEETGYTETEGSLMLSVFGVATIIGIVGLGWIGDLPWVNITKTYGLCLVACGISILLFPILIRVMDAKESYSFYILALNALFFGLTFSSSYSYTPSILVELIALERFTMAYGLVLLSQGLGHLIGPPMAGALKDKTGYWDAAFYIAGIWVIVSGLLVAVIPYTKNFRIIGNAPLAKDVAVDPEPGVKIIIAH